MISSAADLLKTTPLFGQKKRPSSDDGLSEADKYLSNYFQLGNVSPEEKRARLLELRRQGGDNRLPYDHFYGNANIPDIDEQRSLFTDLKEPASLAIMFRQFPFEGTDPTNPPFSITWDEQKPVFKQSNAVARKLGPVYPWSRGEKSPEEFAFPLHEVEATVKMDFNQPGPVRAWRYEKNGRHHRVAVLWQNADESRQYLLFEDKVGNFDSPFRREKTDQAFDVFKQLNRFLAANYKDSGNDMPSSQ